MILYTQKTCPKCDAVKDILAKAGHVYDVSTDVDKALSLGITSVPVLVSDSGAMYKMKQIIDICKDGGSFE